jgi:uncharacterized repeat protein (TIGR04138 family)
MSKSPDLYEIIGKITTKDLRYREKAYIFVLSALNKAADSLPERRHITGKELCEKCRELAIQEYGPFARSVLDHWGISSTEDFGELIFNLLDRGILIKTEEDSKEDFVNVFDFNEAFEGGSLGEGSSRETEEEE